MKTWRALGLALAVVFASGGIGLPAGAQTQGGGQGEKGRALRQHIDGASADESRLLERIDEANRRKAPLDAKVGVIDRQIDTVQGELSGALARLGALATRQRGAEARLAETRQKLSESKDELARQAIAAYTGQSGVGRFTEVLLHARSLDDLASKRTYLSAASDSQATAISNTEHLRDQVDDLRGELDAARRVAQSQADVVAGRRAALQARRNEADGLRRSVSAEIAELTRARDEVLGRKDEFESQARALEQQSNGIADSLRQAQADRPVAARPGKLAPPLSSIRVVSPFGMRVHPIYHTLRMHTGADLDGNTGDPIHAAADGVVTSAGPMGGYGNATIIDHGGGLATLYAHQSAILVSVGQKVTQGQVIGRVGCTGACTGPHLHFEVRINGTPVNPVPYI